MVPHWVQGMLNLAPQAVQYLRPELSGKPHWGQLIALYMASTLYCPFPKRPVPQRNAQSGQNLESGGTIPPHWGQGVPILWPQLIQKLKPFALSVLQ